MPPSEFLLEDFLSLTEMLNGLRRTYPATRWVEELVAKQEAVGFAGLL